MEDGRRRTRRLLSPITVNPLEQVVINGDRQIVPRVLQSSKVNSSDKPLALCIPVHFKQRAARVAQPGITCVWRCHVRAPIPNLYTDHMNIEQNLAPAVMLQLVHAQASVSQHHA